MKIKEILNDIQYVDDFEDFDVLDISYDSRKVRKGTLFVAIMGQEFDGHDFIEEAEKNGAVAIVKEKGVKSKCKIIEIEVVNTRKVLAKIANNFFQNPSSKIGTVGITGTNGKTTTTFLINKIFNECGNTSGSIGTLGFVSPSNIISTGFTTPESLELNNFMDKLVSGGIKNVILEVSSHALALSRMENIQIDTAVFTNLSREHLDYHGTMEKYFSEKLKLFTSLKEEANSVINIDDIYSKKIISEIKSKVITYGINNEADIKLISKKISYKGMKLTIDLFGNKYTINTKITGTYNIYNIMAAIGVCIANNISIELIINSIEKIDGIPGRMEFVGDEKNRIFIDYAHTPDAYENIFKLVDDIKDKKDKIITLFGCGGDRDREKRPEMARISEKYSDKIIVTTDNPRTENIDTIIKDIMDGFKYRKHVVIEDREVAIIESIKMMSEDEVLIVLGKGRENYQIFDREKKYHNDVEIIQREINAN